MSTQPPISSSHQPTRAAARTTPVPVSSRAEGNEDQRPPASSLIRHLADGFAAAASQIVPWFLETMPQSYFRHTPAADQAAHLRAIIAARASDQPISMSARSADGRTWTFLREEYEEGLVGQLLRQMPPDDRLRSANVYSARDRSLVVAVFHFGEAPRFDPTNAALAVKRTRVLELSVAAGQDGTQSLEALGAHFEACGYDYLRAVHEEQIWRHFLTCRRLVGGNGVEVALRPTGPEARLQVRLDVAAAGVSSPRLFERVSSHLGRWGLDIDRAYLDQFETSRGPVVNLGVVLASDERLAPNSPGRARLTAELKRLVQLDDGAIALMQTHPEHFDLTGAEIALALVHLASATLGREDALAYSRERLLQLVDRHPDFIARLTDCLRQSPTPGEQHRRMAKQLTSSCEELETDARERRAFEHLVRLVQGTMRTNVDHADRWALMLRLTPDVVMSSDRPAPHGIFFAHGRGFDAFHVRFRDVARGGMRVVAPRGPEQYAAESQKMFDEAYDLAFAQQLKNKDIPEGGAKAVILVAPGEPIEPAVRGFVDSLLDLVSVTEEGAEAELIYLGPDENISEALIEWTVARATERHYPLPTTFMSSKPGAGINHKAYGVTSEGVIVFLDEALKRVGIDPKRDPFTVKLTGGPDGDVAGNAIRILFREYGGMCRIVGIADGSGAADDPDGLDADALVELVAQSAPIAAFPVERLGPRGQVVPVDAPGGAKRRDRLHHEVMADVFIPAGGRPGTIHENNWADHQRDGVPASRVIVEGANLFLTTAARQALSKELGILVIKDSSANKCGVICSSFEVLAGMLLTPGELMADKERFVAEVLARLRHLARREAKLLFNEHLTHPERTLPELSIELSRTIERVADRVFEAYPILVKQSPEIIRALVLDHLPPLLVERATDRIDDLPASYQAGLVAASLSARLVYREGLSFVAELPDGALAPLALRYFTSETESRSLAAAVRRSSLADRERIADLLERGGPRAGLLDG